MHINLQSTSGWTILTAIATAVAAVATVVYMFVTKAILQNTNRQNALITVLQLFEDIKNDYNGVEITRADGGLVKRGYDGFYMAFYGNNDINNDLNAEQTPHYLASFRLIVTNYSILLDKLNLLDKGNKETLVSFVYLFYKERLQPYIDKVLTPYDNIQKAIEDEENGEYRFGEKRKFTFTPEDEEKNRIKTEKVKIFIKIRDQIKELNSHSV